MKMKAALATLPPALPIELLNTSCLVAPREIWFKDFFPGSQGRDYETYH